MREGRRMQELCRDQREEILSLKQRIADRDKQLAVLTKLVRKYSAVLPEFPSLPPSNPTGNDFWSPLFPHSSQASLSFSEIAAKGLWVTASKPPHQTRTRRLQVYGGHQSDSLPEIHVQDSQSSRKNSIYGKKGALRGRPGRRVSEANGDPLPALRPVQGHY